MTAHHLPSQDKCNYAQDPDRVKAVHWFKSSAILSRAQVNAVSEPVADINRHAYQELLIPLDFGETADRAMARLPGICFWTQFIHIGV